MLRRTAQLGMLFSALALAACNSDVLPAGTAGTVTVRVYVDADGSADFSAGDPVFTATVTLLGAGGASQEASTDAGGIASFSSVMPGSYSATLSGSVPAGAVLASAESPTIVVPFGGGEVAAQFRYVFNPGTVSGVLFRDDNGNGVFDPGTDTPAPGMQADLFAGASATGTPVATTTTGSGGEFQFTTVRPGSYTLKVTAIPTIQIVGGETRAITVDAQGAAEVPVQFTGNLLISIAQVRSAPVGMTVAFEGTATVNAAITGSNQLYVQDANAGVLVFGAPTAGIVAGDQVRVVGAVAIFNGELEIAAPSGGTLSVTKLSSGAVPAPRSLTVPQVLSNQYLGQLVSLLGLRVRSVATTGATSYNVNVVGDMPADTFQVRIGNSNNVPIPVAFWEVGRKYDVTGLVGVFNGLIQLKPRAPGDAIAGLLTQTIAEARAHASGDTVTVEGVIYVGTAVYTLASAANWNFYMEDATGGTQVFNVPNGTSYAAGDSVRVRGAVSFFNAEYEIARFNASSPPVIDRLGSGMIPHSRTLSGMQLASKAFDGQLVRLSGLQVVSVSTPNASGAYNVVTTAPDGTAVTARIDASPVGIVNTSWMVGMSYDVTGAALNFSTNGTSFTPEVKPRSPADVELSTPTVISILAARAINNDTVTVEGVVIAGQGTFRSDNAYIQDATGGVQIFNLPSGLMLHTGDQVRVHGKMTTFSSEKEITNNLTPSDSIRVTKLGDGVAPPPRVVTGAEFAARTYEGQLLTLTDVAILTVGTPSGSGTYTVTGTAADGTPVTLFMSAPVGSVPPPATFAVGAHYDLTGVAVPFSGAAELKPRGAADVVAR